MPERADLTGIFLHSKGPWLSCDGHARPIEIPKWIAVKTATAYGLVYCEKCRTHRFDVQLSNGELHSLHSQGSVENLVEYVRVSIEGGTRICVNIEPGDCEERIIPSRLTTQSPTL